MVNFLFTFRILVSLLPILLFNHAYTIAEPIIQDDRQSSRALDFPRDPEVVEVLRSGYQHLVERYVPDFLGVDRSIIGRAGDEIQALGNNAPGKSNIEEGQSQFYTFPKKTLLGEKSPSTPGLPSIIGQRALQDGDEEGIPAELRKRQNTEGVTLYVSLNTCEQPTSKIPNTNGAPDQLKLYVSTSSSNQKPDASNNNYAVPVDGGFASLNITVNDDVFLGVSAPSNGEFTGIYNYELTASIDEYYASYHDETYTYFVDSDTNSALLFTNDTTSQNSSSVSFKQWMSLSDSPPFSIYVQNQDNPSILGMQNSMCALKSYAQVQGRANIDTSMTVSGDGQPKQQFHVKGLNGSSAYYAIMGVDGNSTDSGGGVVSGGGTVWKSANFSTKADNNCAVVYNLPFCSDVAYAVPSNTSQPNTTALSLMYDGWASEMYTNFSKSLQQIPCNTTSSAQYSLTRNCTDCANAYKEWLCAVTIPRCQDFSNPASYLQPRNVAQNFTNNTSGSGPLFSADNLNKVYMNSSRNTLIDSDIAPGPYKEVLPCQDLCFHLVQNCPAKLQFVCPLEGYGLNYTYGIQQTEGIGPGEITCNYLNTNTNAATSLRGFVVLGASVGISTILLIMAL